MFKKSRKSAAYKPFLKCVDPKGVADETVRKPKADLPNLSSKTEGGQRNPKNSREGVSCRGLSGKPQDDTIGSPSRGLNFNSGTKDVTEDLLRGALDLQESLIMLEKLQKASQPVSNLKKPHHNADKGKIEEDRIEELCPIQFRCSHGRSRNTCEKVRKETGEEDRYFAPRKLDLASSELATTSSSRFSVASSDESASTDSLLSAAHTLKKKAAGPNVIARLMGLEDMPSRPSRAALGKKLETEKIADHRKLVFDVDIARARNHQFVGQRPVDDAPTIVIMKPLNVRSSRSSEFYSRAEYLAAKVDGFPGKAADCEERGLNCQANHSRMRVEAVPIRRPGQEEGTEECKEVIITSEAKKVRQKEGTFSKNKFSAPVSFKPKKEEMVDQKFCKIHKAAPFSRKNAMPEELKPKTVLQTQDRDSVFSTVLGKPENGFSHSIVDLKRNDIEKQSTGKVKGAGTVHGRLEHHDEARKIDLPCITDPILMTTGAATADQHTRKAPKDGVPSSQHEERINSSWEGVDAINHSIVKRTTSIGARSSMKALLLSSPSFLDHAKELFNLNTNQLISLQAYEIKEFSPKLSLDCSNEILERKLLHDTQRGLLVLQACKERMARNPISLDQLIDEVCDELEDLKCYGSLARENSDLGSFNSAVERDMRSRGVVSGMWDFGWMNDFSMDDVEGVVGEIDKFILSNLTEDLVQEFLSLAFSCK